MTSFIEIKNLCVGFDGVEVLKNLNLEVNEGEIFGLIGVSGAGKTTTSKIISGLLKPTSGSIEVRIGDEWIDLTQLGAEKKGRATKYIGVLHQEYSLYPHRNIEVAKSIIHVRKTLGETFVIVSHDMDFVAHVCDRTALMRLCKIVYIGETNAVLSKLSEKERKNAGASGVAVGAGVC